MLWKRCSQRTLLILWSTCYHWILRHGDVTEPSDYSVLWTPGYSQAHSVIHSDLSHNILFLAHLLVSLVVPSRQSRRKLNCSSSYIPPYCPVQHCLSAWFSSMAFMIPFGLEELNTPQGLIFTAVIFLNAFEGLKPR